MDESKFQTWCNNVAAWWEKTKKILSITCPVDISVYDLNGKQIGYVGENDIWYDEDLLYIQEDGNAKILYSFTDDLVSLNMSATDYGVLGCSIEECDESGQPTERTNFYDIDLYPGKDLSVLSSQNTPNDDINYTIVTDGKTIHADEKVLPGQDASVTINCGDTTGGSVQGAGEYVRGDAVVLLAIPEEEYKFAGWYKDDLLVGTSKLYEFTAREDVNLHAAFYTKNNGNIENLPQSYIVTFSANSGSVTISNLSTNADGKLSNLPIPTRTGYTFNGWYTASTGGTKVTTDTVFDQNTTLYAQWTSNGNGSSNSNGNHSSGNRKPSTTTKPTPAIPITPTTPTNTVKLDTSTVNIINGNSYAFLVNGNNDTANIKVEVVNPNVASVTLDNANDPRGAMYRVTAKTAGSTEIKVTYQGQTTSMKVNVAESKGSITLDTANYILAPGNQYTIGAFLKDSVGNALSAEQIKTMVSEGKLKVRDSRTGSIVDLEPLSNGNFRVTGKNEGTTYIIYEVGGTHASVRVDVQTGVQQHGTAVRNTSYFVH